MEHRQAGLSATPPEDLPVAATVVLLRDADAGPEVLLLERPHDRGSFAGAWVFPGGGVDEADHKAGPPEEEAAARRAGVREVQEESGLDVPLAGIVTLSRWTPPAGVPKRMRTWFFLARAPEGSIRLAAEEVVDHRWIRPADALADHAAGALLLMPPTWVTLHGLRAHGSVADALAAARAHGRRDFLTRIVESEGGRVLLWPGDVAHTNTALLHSAGGRHRLQIAELPWTYSDEPDPG